MSVLVDKNTRLLVQGITGKSGAFHARGCRDYGTNVVAGVTPGRGGEKLRRDDSRLRHRRRSAPANRLQCHHDLRAPARARRTASSKPPTRAWNSSCASPRASRSWDMMRVKEALAIPARTSGSSGRIARGSSRPSNAKSASCPATSTSPAPSASSARSGTLTYEAVWQLTSPRPTARATCIGIGGDPINGTSHLDAVKLFAADEGTEAFILIGEIGGSAEEEAAAWIARELPEAGGGIHCRGDRASRAAHGPRGSHRQRGSRHGGRQDRRTGEAAGIAVAKSPATMADTLIASLKGKTIDCSTHWHESFSSIGAMSTEKKLPPILPEHVQTLYDPSGEWAFRARSQSGPPCRSTDATRPPSTVSRAETSPHGDGMPLDPSPNCGWSTGGSSVVHEAAPVQIPPTPAPGAQPPAVSHAKTGIPGHAKPLPADSWAYAFSTQLAPRPICQPETSDYIEVFIPRFMISTRTRRHRRQHHPPERRARRKRPAHLRGLRHQRTRRKGELRGVIFLLWNERLPQARRAGSSQQRAPPAARTPRPGHRVS